MNTYDRISDVLGLRPITIEHPPTVIPLSKGMSGFVGKSHTEEWKMQAAERGRNRVWTSETKAKISEKKKGTVFTEEHRAKLSLAKKGKKLSEEHKAKITANNHWNKKRGS